MYLTFLSDIFHEKNLPTPFICMYEIQFDVMLLLHRSETLLNAAITRWHPKHIPKIHRSRRVSQKYLLHISVFIDPVISRHVPNFARDQSLYRYLRPRPHINICLLRKPPFELCLANYLLDSQIDVGIISNSVLRLHITLVFFRLVKTIEFEASKLNLIH